MLSDARVHGTRASLCFCTCKQEREKPRTKKHSKNRTQRSVSVHTHATHVRTHHTDGKQTETSAQDERGACCAGHVPDLLAWQKRPAHLAYLAKETYFYAHEGHHTARTRTHVRAWTHTPHVHYTTQPGLGSLREIASSLRGCLYNLASSECHFAYTCSHTHTHTHTHTHSTSTQETNINKNAPGGRFWPILFISSCIFVKGSPLPEPDSQNAILSLKLSLSAEPAVVIRRRVEGYRNTNILCQKESTSMCQCTREHALHACGRTVAEQSASAHAHNVHAHASERRALDH